MKWPEKFDSILIAPRFYRQFKSHPERAEPELAAKIAGIEIITDAYMPETGAALMLKGEIVGWIEFVKGEGER